MTGRGISLLFTVGDELTIFGTGLGEDDLAGCPAEIAGELGGPFAGPADGDLGDWRRRGKPGKGVLNVTGDSEAREDLADLDKDYEEVGTESGACNNAEDPCHGAAGDE